MRTEIQNHIIRINGFESYQNFYDVKSTSDYLYFSYDLDFERLNYLSSSVYSMLGYKNSDLLDKDLKYLGAIIHPEDFLILVCNVNSYLKKYNCSNKKYTGLIDLKLRLKHNDNFWINSFNLISVLNNGVRESLVGIVKKIYGENISYKTTSQHKLTNREMEVLQLVSNGKTSNIIAEILHINVTTVITHRKSLNKKLNVSNSSQMIKKAFILGIL